MNRLGVDGQIFDVTEHYRAGALAARAGALAYSNPSPRSFPGYTEWQAGFDNENRFVHVVEGTDVISADHRQSRVFCTETAPQLARAPRAAKLGYFLALMRATPLLAVANDALIREPGLAHYSLRAALRAEGFPVSEELSKCVLRRAVLERAMATEHLSEHDLQQLATMTPSRRALVTAMAELQDKYYDGMIQPQVLAKRMGKEISWLNPTVRTLRQDGWHTLFRFTRTHAALTPKGWAAYWHLSGRDISRCSDHLPSTPVPALGR